MYFCKVYLATASSELCEFICEISLEPGPGLLKWVGGEFFVSVFLQNVPGFVSDDFSATRSVEVGERCIGVGEVVSPARLEEEQQISGEDDGGRLEEDDQDGGRLAEGETLGFSSGGKAKGGRRKRCEMKDETVEAVQGEGEENREREEEDDRSEGGEGKVEHIEGKQEEEDNRDEGKEEGEEEEEEEEGERARSCMGKRVR